ncbi:MAG: TIGR03088 family PEP-CTERM/XrtA system glycosyltransferase [Gammaproteobacteria bacterium]
MSQAPLIAHIIHHFDVGGLENGLVNLINRMPADRYRHAVVCLDGYTDFRKRIEREDVQFYALGKQPGHDLGLYWRLWRVLRQLRPDIVHTRNLSALEGQFVAALAGVRARVHGEHGRDVFDLHGHNRKYNLLRKLARPLVQRYIALSRDLQSWLVQTVGVPPERIAQIYNGVDSARFHPRAGERTPIGPPGFLRGGEIVIGSVGRMAEVKDYPTLVRAFLQVVEVEPLARERLRLVIVGDGPSRAACLEQLRAADATEVAWLPGERPDVPDIMRALDMFVSPSLGEGISNTILEAMASGLPVVATRVGGNPELVEAGRTGQLVPPGDAQAMAQALKRYLDDGEERIRHGLAAREKAERLFSMEAMVRRYGDVYDQILQGRQISVLKES